MKTKILLIIGLFIMGNLKSQTYNWALGIAGGSPSAITIDNDNKLILVGAIQDGFVAQYDSAGNNLWTFILSGATNASCRDVVTDIYGNIYITGMFQGTLDFDPSTGVANLTSTGVQDAYIAKYNSSGNFNWVKKISGTLPTSGHSITLDTDNNIYVTGKLRGTADFDPSTGVANLTSAGNDDIFIAKYNAAGFYLWAINPQGINQDYSYSIKVDKGNNVYVTGTFQGTVDFDPSSGTANLTASSLSAFVAKYNSSGNYLWAINLKGTYLTAGTTIAIDMVGNINVGGWFNGTVDFDPSTGVANLTSSNDEDFFIAQYDSSGNYLWAIDANGTSKNRIYSLSLDKYNSIYVAGDFNGIADFDPSSGTANLLSVGNTDAFVAKYDSVGNYLWAFSMGGSDYGGARSISIDKKEQIYVTGTLRGMVDFDPDITNAYLTSSVGNSIFLARYDQCLLPNSPTLYSDVNTVCSGEKVNIRVDTLNKLYHAKYWYIYSDSCSGTPIDSNVVGIFNVFPITNKTYYVGGSGGCVPLDSCTAISINVNPVYLTNVSISICPDDSSLLGGTYQKIAGIYYDTLFTINGCDSVIATNLIINKEYTISTSFSICKNESILLGGSYQNVSGIYYDSLFTINGCDSVIITTLTVNPTYNTPVSIVICINDSILLQGAYQTTAGTYYDTLSSVNGCDSIIATNLSVTALPTQPTIQNNSCNLAATTIANVTYQWYLSGNPITGATSKFYTATSAGYYEVKVIDVNSCSSTSDAVYADCGTEIKEHDISNYIHLHPNPSDGNFDLQLTTYDLRLNNAALRIYNVLGEIVYQQTLNFKHETLNTKLTKGVYFLQLQSEQGVVSQKIVVQ